jgi:uncharacterized membrane protein YhhN
VSAPIALTLLALAALLVAEFRDARIGVWIAKPLASLGFVWLGFALGDFNASGAATLSYAGLVVTGLLLSMLGDVLLIPRGRPLLFQLGIGSFLLAHVAYAGAFALRSFDWVGAGIGVLLILGPAGATLRWLRPTLPADFVGPVYAYILVISTMVVSAIACVWAGADARILLGALLFAGSDISVARDRFVTAGFVNGAWGLPMYFVAQLVLAGTIASA